MMVTHHNHPAFLFLPSTPSLTQTPSHVGPGLLSRGLGTSLPRNTNFTDQQIHVLQVIAVSAAAISLTLALLTFYWFLRMRRSYRHHLIMLLIMSDGFKSLWYMVYPLVSFQWGFPPNESPICQASGFFIALGTEASDFAVLIIAIHTALYIFKTHSSTGEAGIYTYRWLAYVGWIVFPVLMASLAFINPIYPYVGMNTFCTLPVRPFWYRLALSWIPRYIILGTITLLYVVIYLHVKLKFKAFMGESQESYDKATGESKTAVTDSAQRDTLTDSILAKPPSITLTRHGLIGGNNSDFGGSGKNRESHHESMSLSSLPPSPARRSSLSIPSPVWEHYSFGGSEPIDSVSTPIELPPIIKRISDIHPEAGYDQSSSYFRLQSTTAGADPSNDLEAFPLPRDGATETLHFHRSSPNPVYVSEAVTLDESAGTVPSIVPNVPGLKRLRSIDAISGPVDRIMMKRRHRAIISQLRLVFIYPLVYALLWIIPFAAHCLLYSDYFVMHPLFPLNCVNVAILSLQGAVNCIVFGIREKPWRMAEKCNGTLLNSFKFWKDDWSIKPNVMGATLSRVGARKARSRVPKVGRTSGEMLAEARQAKGRRDAERELLWSKREAMEGERKDSIARRGGRTERTWWEVEGWRRKDSVMLGTDGAGGRDDTSLGSRSRSQSRLASSRRSESQRKDIIMEESAPETKKELHPDSIAMGKPRSILSRKRHKEKGQGPLGSGKPESKADLDVEETEEMSDSADAAKASAKPDPKKEQEIRI